MPKTKKYLPFPLFLLIAGIVGVSSWVVIKSLIPVAKPIGINEVVATGTTTLDASPTPINMYIGKTTTIDINAHSGTDKVSGIELELTYNPANLQITSFNKTDYLPTYFVEPQLTSGKVIATVVAPPESGGRADWGTVGKLTFKSLSLGTQLISFGANTHVATVSNEGNSLKKADPISVYVFNLGDLNYDKKVDLFDYNFLVAKFGNPFTIYDYNSIVANYGKTSP